MTRRRATVGLCMLCALAISALAVQGASAAIKGTTLFTCKATGSGAQFKDAHCKEAGSGSGFQHVAIAQDTTTEVEFAPFLTGSESSSALLESKQAGIAEQLKATEGSCTGCSVQNKVTASGEHYLHGEGKFSYRNVTVTKPAGKGCSVVGGAITTNLMTITSEATVSGMELRIQPKTGNVVAEYEITGCSTAALNGKYTTSGSLTAELDGATVKATHANVTGQGTLAIREQTAGIESAITLKGKHPENAEAFTALAATTIETP